MKNYYIPLLLLLNILVLLLYLILREKNALIDALSESCQTLEDELIALKAKQKQE